MVSARALRPGALGRVGRGGQHVLVLLAAVLVNFALPRALPGEPLATIAGGEVGALSAEQRDALLAQYGLDRPLPVQFGDYLADLARLDLGTSLADGRPVSVRIGERIGWTLLLVGGAVVVTTLAAVALALLTVRRRNDAPVLTAALLLDAVPPFWTGMLLMFLFGVQWQVLPTFGARPLAGAEGGLAGLAGVGTHLVLPLTTLLAADLAHTYLVARSSLRAVARAPHLRLARAKGVPERRILLRHALRPAALPITTLLLLDVGVLVGGAVVVETVFAYPGVGSLLFEAVRERDLPVLQGGFLILTATIVTANLAADALAPRLDPRLRRAA
jgi:peptide/nickel transport system permease protein